MWLCGTHSNINTVNTWEGTKWQAYLHVKMSNVKKPEEIWTYKTILYLFIDRLWLRAELGTHNKNHSFITCAGAGGKIMGKKWSQSQDTTRNNVLMPKAYVLKLEIHKNLLGVSTQLSCLILNFGNKLRDP